MQRNLQKPFLTMCWDEVEIRCPPFQLKCEINSCVPLEKISYWMQKRSKTFKNKIWQSFLIYMGNLPVHQFTTFLVFKFDLWAVMQTFDSLCIFNCCIIYLFIYYHYYFIIILLFIFLQSIVLSWVHFIFTFPPCVYWLFPWFDFVLSCQFVAMTLFYNLLFRTDPEQVS